MARDTVLGFVIIDAVIGKFELINYAVAPAPDGSIRDVDILPYRESRGAEVRTADRRRPFVGKTASAPHAAAAGSRRTNSA